MNAQDCNKRYAFQKYWQVKIKKGKQKLENIIIMAQMYLDKKMMKRFLKWVKWIGLVLISLVVLLLLTGFIFERISQNDAEKIKPDGNFVELKTMSCIIIRKVAEDQLWSLKRHLIPQDDYLIDVRMDQFAWWSSENQIKRLMTLELPDFIGISSFGLAFYDHDRMVICTSDVYHQKLAACCFNPKTSQLTILKIQNHFMN